MEDFLGGDSSNLTFPIYYTHFSSQVPVVYCTHLGLFGCSSFCFLFVHLYSVVVKMEGCIKEALLCK